MCFVSKPPNIQHLIFGPGLPMRRQDISSTLLLFTVLLLQLATYSSPLCEQTRKKKKRGVSSTPAGSHLQQERSDKPIVLKLPSAEQQAAKAIEWQINTVEHRAQEIYFPRALLGIKEGSQESQYLAGNIVKMLNIVL